MVTYLEHNAYMQKLEDERDAAMAEAEALRERLAVAERRMVELGEDLELAGRRAASGGPGSKPRWPTGEPRGVPFCERCAGPAADRLPLGPGLDLDRRAGCLLYGGRPVRVPPAEYRFLEALACRPGEPLSHADLALAVWDSHYRCRPTDAHGLRTMANRLRIRLRGLPVEIETVYKLGYLLRPGGERA